MKCVIIALALILPLAGQVQQSENHPSQANTGSALNGRVAGDLEVLTNTQGIDLGPYLSKMLRVVRMNWYHLIPSEARAPDMKKGTVVIEFAVLRNGSLSGMSITEASGDLPMDRAAWGGITASAPFAPLPVEFQGSYLRLRFHFHYNPDKKISGEQQPAQH